MKDWPKICCFGDSITRRSMDPENGCWTSYVSHKVAHYFQVDIRGFDGYNSKWALELMPELFPKDYLDKVEIFILFFGHNDAWNELFPLHVPVKEYEKNMEAIIKYLMENGVDNSKIILITPTWYHKEAWQKALTQHYTEETLHLKPHKNHENQALYSEVILRLAKENNIEVLDFFQISTKYQPFPDLFYDGLHLSRDGAKLLANSVLPIIEKKIKAKFGKPIEELWRVIPYHERPEIKPLFEKYLK